MRRALVAAAAAVFAFAAPSRTHAADCPPPAPLLAAVRGSSRVQLEHLGSDEQRVETTLAHVPGRTLGYEVHGVIRVTGAAAIALRDAFGRRDSYACTPELPAALFETPSGLPIGVWFGARPQAVAVVLHLPEGRIELQSEGGPRVSVPLSRAGQRRWELALASLARETRTTPADFYRQMTPPDRTPSLERAPADTASPPRDAPQRPR